MLLSAICKVLVQINFVITAIVFLTDFKSLQTQRKKDLLSCLNIKSYEDLGSYRNTCRQSANDFINW